MDAVTLKQQFLARLPQELVEKMPKIYDQIIDEGVEAVLAGNANFDGRMPSTEQEWFIVLGIHFATATAALEGVIKGTRKAFAKEPVNININYRGDTHSFQYDALED